MPSRNRADPRKRQSRLDFTLVEAMLVISLIGLLGSVTYPSHRLDIARTHRSEALLALSSIYEWQPGYFVERGLYAGTFNDLTVIQ